MPKSCSVRCAVEFPVLYPQYLAILQAAKAAGIITDFAGCHGVVGDQASLVRALTDAGLPEEGAREIARTMAMRCLKCGCDEVFG